MAGDIFGKERAIVTLTSVGSSLTSGSAGAGGSLDVRAAGNVAEDQQAIFELLAQWGTVTGIVANMVVADLFLVPLADGSNAADVDATSGASVIQASAYIGSFQAPKTPSASTNMRFTLPAVPLFPGLFTAYLLNRSGQTISANWTLRAVSARSQYS